MCLWCLNTAGRAAALSGPWLAPSDNPAILGSPTPSPWHLHGPHGWWLIGQILRFCILFWDLASAWLLCSRTAGLGAGGGPVPLPSFPEGTGGHSSQRPLGVKREEQDWTLVLLILSHTLSDGQQPCIAACLLDFCQQHPLAQGSLLLHHRERPQLPPSEPSKLWLFSSRFPLVGVASSWAVMLRTSWDNVLSVAASHNCFPTASALLTTAGTPEHTCLFLWSSQMFTRLRSAPVLQACEQLFIPGLSPGDVAWWAAVLWAFACVVPVDWLLPWDFNDQQLRTSTLTGCLPLLRNALTRWISLGRTGHLITFMGLFAFLRPFWKITYFFIGLYLHTLWCCYCLVDDFAIVFPNLSRYIHWSW